MTVSSTFVRFWRRRDRDHAPTQYDRNDGKWGSLTIVVACLAAGSVAIGCSDPRVDGPLASEGRLPKPPAGAQEVRVERVVDGDTAVFTEVGKARLIGVDTPEVFGGVECFGREASAFAKRLLAGARVKVARQAQPTDRYGRALVDVWLEDGRFFNAMLVARGYAQPLTIPPNVEHAAVFVRLQRQARAAQRGLWGRHGCRRG